MNRNSENHFALNPYIDRARSKFNCPQDIKTTFNTGELIPFYVEEILPGDTAKIKTNKVVRLQTPLAPFMDNIYLDTYYFFVPNRLVWSHWQNFCGESDSGWLPEASYTVPQVTSPSSTGWTKGTIADQMGIPTGKTDLSVNALPFRAYAKIVQDWFLWTPLQDPVNIPVNESTVAGSNGSNYINDLVAGGMPFVCKKMANYFTMALPTPQRGPASSIQLANVSGPVFGTGKSLTLTDGTNYDGLYWNNSLGVLASYTSFNKNVGTGDNTGTDLTTTYSIGVPTESQLKSKMGDNYDASATGLFAQMSTSTLVTINELRQAFQIQKWYESLARGGDRYISILKEMFGVTSPDARLQRSEYLGGNRVPIQVNSVIQTSATQYSSTENAISGNPMGTAGAYSVTVDTHYDVEKSFVEHGFIIGVMVARFENSYQQGLEKFWSRSTKFDYYWPVFQNLGEMAIKNKEIYAQGSSVINSDTGKAYDEEVFGYQEAWADYRYKPNHICGEMRSTYSTPLDSWHLGDEYNALPSLSSDWIKTDKSNVDRVLCVTSSVADQFFADIFVENEMIRPMPLYSIPGLMDHN